MCFYSDPEIEDQITLYPSVISKIDYIARTVKLTGRQVHMVSVAPSRKGGFRGYRKGIDSQESHTYLPSVVSENRILSKCIEFLLFGRQNFKHPLIDSSASKR